jgi:phosphoribosylformylglycinamidine synthase subunit PurQ / glutaminase
MKFGVIIFPGSNCDHDAYWTIQQVEKQPVTFLWHESHDLQNCDAIIVPGGFAFGDYLRTGAIAKFSPVMESVRRFADGGGLVLGICNGFQILCEAGLLPGVLMRNAQLRFICKMQYVRVENAQTPFTRRYAPGRAVKFAIAHGEGNFIADAETIGRIEAEGRVAFRYCDAQGRVGESSSPNGAINSIAGVFNDRFNVLGLMPHPENLIDPLVGGTDGRALFDSLAA